MAVLHHHEGRVGLNLLGNIDIDMPLIAAGLRQLLGRPRQAVAIRIALVGEIALDPHDAGIDLAVLGIEDEFAQIALRHRRIGDRLGRVGVIRPDDAVLGRHRRRRGGEFFLLRIG